MLFARAQSSLTTPLPRSCCPPPFGQGSCRYHLCDVLLLHMFFPSAPSLFPFPPFSPFSYTLPAIVSSVRRGPVLFTSLSPQDRDSLLCLQPLPEARVQGLHPAQPPPALFLQHWARPRPPAPHHPSKYPVRLPTLLPNPRHRPWPSRHPGRGGVTSRG